MKNLALIAIGIFLIGCQQEESNIQEEEIKKVDTLKKVIEVKSIKDLSQFDEQLKEYKACKELSKDKSDCKEFVAKAFCTAYGVSDFEDGGNYIDYDKITDRMAELPKWKKIGEVNKENLEVALKKLNAEGLPVVVFDTKKKYSPICILKEKGGLKRSNQWGGLEVPSCIAFFSHKPSASSVDIGLNYVFSKPSNLEIWYRNY